MRRGLALTAAVLAVLACGGPDVALEDTDLFRNVSAPVPGATAPSIAEAGYLESDCHDLCDRMEECLATRYISEASPMACYMTCDSSLASDTDMGSREYRQHFACVAAAPEGDCDAVVACLR